MNHIAYLVGEFKRLTGQDLEYSFDGFHRWKAGNWAHTTRGSYQVLTFYHLKTELDRLVSSFRSKLNDQR